MALSQKRLYSILESLLLVTSEPLEFERIVEVIRGENAHTDPEAIREALSELIRRYGQPKRDLASGFQLVEVAGRYQFRTTAENAQYIRRYLAARPQRMTRPALETLAIIAYRQPVTKPDIEAIRGVDCGAVIKALLERDLIRILGKLEEVGRPILYGTTEAFLELFGIKSLTALPTLREYHELDEAHQAQVDEIYEREDPSIADLAATAEFLVDRDHDPDLDALDEALNTADEASKATEAFLAAKNKAAAEPQEEEAAAEPQESPTT